MIELPEAVTIARQVNEHLRSAAIAESRRENSPHKFVFYSRPREEYERLLPGRIIEAAEAWGAHVDLRLSGGLWLQLGGGGERILLHESGAQPPKKYHLLLRFDDGRLLSVTVQGWGSARLLDAKQLADVRARYGGADPLAKGFDAKAFLRIFEDYAAAGDKPVKAFFTSESPILGVGNGYLQDILWRARVHPRTKVRQVDSAARGRLCTALRKVLAEAVAKGGRDDELDLLGNGGCYVRTLDRRSVGKPCPACGTPIEKFSFLGGACYVCPSCQTV